MIICKNNLKVRCIYMEKILTFVIYKNKFLLLLGNENDPQFHKSFWYVITGAVESEDTNFEDAVKRELKEETNLDALKIKDMAWTFEYNSLGKHCIEHAYLTYVSNDLVVLNEESIDYKWCNLNEFLSLIKWYGDKEELKYKLLKFVK